jgi:hypothetical protein
MKKALLCATLLCFLSREAYMSTVHHMAITSPMEAFVDQLTNRDHILILKGPLAGKTFKKIVLPRRTHHSWLQESTYEEIVYHYQVVEAIRSDRFKKDDLIWVWSEPDYSLDSIKMHHEEGILESPAILTREPEFEIKGDLRLVIATQLDKGSSEFSVVYAFTMEEGAEAKAKILQLLTERNR